MFRNIIGLSWKSFMRSPAFTQNLFTTIMMIVLGLYFGAMFVLLGAGVPFIIAEASPDSNGPLLFGRYFIYMILYLFLMRLIFQNFGFQELKQYILQRVPKSTLLHFILTKSIFHWMNVIPLLGIVAYLISSAFAPKHDINILNTALVTIGLLFASNFKAFLFDKQLTINKVTTGLLLALVVVINFLDVKGYIPLGEAFEWIYGLLTANIFTALVPVLSVVVSYYLSFKSLSKVSYLEDQYDDTSVSGINVKSGIFSRFGKVGEMMEMETKLIFRNKRSKNMLYIAVLILIYPAIIHVQNGDMDSMGWKMFIAIFCTGGYAMTYGQLLLSWNSGHFDLLLTKMGSIKEIFQAKYYLQCVIIITQTMLVVLWGFYIPEYFYLMPAMMFYNLGVVLFMYMILASYNSQKIDSNKGAAMNYEGMSMALFLIIIPIMALPLILYYGMSALGHPMLGVVLIALIGLVCFIFNDRLIDLSVRLFKKNRYKIGGAFRAK